MENVFQIDSVPLLPIEQIRLAELSVFNWGSFHGLHTAQFHPEGTLVTGDNGAGKSTLIDGLMALLLPAGRANFNMAASQNDRSDRSLVSYMRGSFGSAHDGVSTRVKSKRDKGVITGLRALYRGDDGSEITLSALFWTTHSSNSLSDIRRLYLVSRSNLTLETLLSEFPDGNLRKLKEWMLNHPEITCCDERFSEYQMLYRRLLHMQNPNAPALLSRALGLKKIDDLTGLIRTLVLEPSNLKSDARKIVEEFSDLVGTYDELVDVRKQVKQLEALPSISDSIKESGKKTANLKSQKNALPSFIAKREVEHLGHKMTTLNEALGMTQQQIDSIEKQEADAAVSVNNFRDEYLNLGGNRIEFLKSGLQETEKKFHEIGKVAARYQETCRALSISDDVTQKQFGSNQKSAQEKRESLDDEREFSQNEFAETASQFSKLELRVREIDQEMSDIATRPGSNIPIKYQQLRDDLSQALDIDGDSIVFIGELIDVKDTELEWQGAIERALGGFRTTLLVPDTYFSDVTRWLNKRHTGLNIRAQVVNTSDSVKRADFLETGFLRKLSWRSHDYRDWLKLYLSRFDLLCVESTSILDKTPFSMTQMGLMHKKKGQFEKKDQTRIDDRRYWQIGFSNETRLEILKNDKKSLLEELKLNETSLSIARASMDNVNDRMKYWDVLLDFQWENLDLPYWQDKLKRDEAELVNITRADGDLKQSELSWENAKSELLTLQQKKAILFTEKGSKIHEITENEKRLNLSTELANNEISEAIFTQLESRIGEVDVDNQQQITLIEQTLFTDIEEVERQKNSFERSAVGIISGFQSKDKWQPITAEWHTGLAGLSEYLIYYRRLEEEGLPKLLSQFIARLNKHTTQSLANFKRKFDDKHDEIRKRIDHINAVLRKTEFKKGSHLKLNSKRESFSHVVDFEQNIEQILAYINDSDHEARFHLLQEVVDILDKASDSTTGNTLESQRLLDPRFQLTFYAEEIDFNTLEVKDVLNSSSGKSGGEKESFAGMIVAASLAYVLTPEHSSKPIYSTVFLDEAFSNTAESVSRRVLRVFKELNIHVNLITPYKNLNLARESAKSLLIAERDPDAHESSLCEVTWEEIDKMIKPAKS